ncbi:hypothetical protein [Streptomyces sp. NBC_00483]|uniref:hypothetical protein n=1 Tax=Streptomyces sp. NBC_00483 TaxID=2975756 RepID=UPI002E17095A
MNAMDTGTPPRRLATARPLENVLVSAALAAQRVSWIDAPARALGLKPFTRRELTRQALAQARRAGSGRPTRMATAFGAFLMPFSGADADALLRRAQEAGALGAVTALDAEGRRTILTPHAAPPPTVNPVAVRSAATEAAAALLAARQPDGAFGRAEWRAVTRRLARRLVLGAGAADDTLVSEILDATARSADQAEHGARSAALRRRIEPYVHEGARAGAGAGPEAAYLEHALEVVTRALAETAPRAFALLATEGVERSVAEAVRRHPPLPATIHAVVAPFRWDDLTVGADTEILCATAWLRDLDEDRDSEGPDIEGRDSGGPDTAGWGSGGLDTADPLDDLSADLCAARVPCPAADLGVLAVTELVRALADRAGADAPTAAREAPDVSAGPVMGADPAHYAALATAGARNLQEHARRLADCARQPGWNHDAFGERCRMTLLAHAERCATAAADARRAADWLAN